MFLQRFAMGMALMGLAFIISACPRREQPPKSSYDSDLMATAAELAKDQSQPTELPADPPEEEVKGECDRLTGGCAEGFLCWDSWYCKNAEDTCSGMGDKKCHKLCNNHSECPKAMPRCVEKPIFRGSDRGKLEKFCVAGQ
ncbi:MAG: hypothetical protein JRF33_03790 [Deltaproteobacteria bacterium]|nr:hypothetical protein [Deltaproteobacteria bacterium]